MLPTVNFLASYQCAINPVEGDKYWEKTFNGQIDPPKIRKKKLGRNHTKRIQKDW